MSTPFEFTVIMPSLNAERTIEQALRSVREQDFPQDRVQILVIDGGSTDKTRTLAAQYQATVIENPMVQQEFAKHIGLLHSEGLYALFLDTDEVMMDRNSLKRKLDTFRAGTNVRVILPSGYAAPQDASAINDYINRMADPFAHFIYHESANKDYRGFHALITKHYPLQQELEHASVLALTARTAPPLADMAGAVCCDTVFLKEILGKQIQSPDFIPVIFQMITARTGCFAVMRDDPVCHYSADTLRTFLRKLRWRVIVNIHYINMPGTGFANRELFQPKRKKVLKYLFIPYAMTLILPMLEGLLYSIRTRKMIFLLHGALTVFTAGMVIYYYLLKIAGIHPRLRSYGREECVLPLSR